jgi:hypothetical protein
MKNGLLIALVGVAAAIGVVLYMRKRNTVPLGAPIYNPVTGQVGAYGVTTHTPVSTAGVALGSILGSSISSWFGGGATSPKQIAPDRNTPYLGDGTISNPVYPLPTVLPYSYKQSVIDTPSLLSTNDIFTPSATGSSGSYADQGTSSDILNNGFG